MKSPYLRLPPLLLLLGSLVACTTGGPKRPYHPPARDAGVASPPSPAKALPAVQQNTWWTSLKSPQLNQLILRGLAANKDLQQTAERVREARALQAEARSTIRPQLGARGSYMRTETDSQTDVGGSLPVALRGLPGVDKDSWAAAADLAWEVDLFGKGRLSIERAGAMADAAEEAEAGMQLAVAAEVADAWFAIATLREELATVDRQLDALAAQLEHASTLFDAGAGTRLDVERESSRLASVEAQGPTLELAMETQRHRLALVLGLAAKDLERAWTDAARLPDALPMIRGGVPADLLTRRPDVRQKARELTAALYDTGGAMAEYMPTFTIAGGPTAYAGSSSDLFDAENVIWQVGPRVEWSLFSGGRKQARFDAAEARLMAAYRAYEQSVLTARNEVELELTSLGAETRRLASVQRARSATRESVKQVANAFEAGAVSRVETLVEEERLREVERQEARARGSVLHHWIRLHRALGGGW